MKATIVVVVPDDFLASRVSEFNQQSLGGDPETVDSYFRGRIADICDDELPIALFSWPADISFDIAPR